MRELWETQVPGLEKLVLVALTALGGFEVREVNAEFFAKYCGISAGTARLVLLELHARGLVEFTEEDGFYQLEKGPRYPVAETV